MSSSVAALSTPFTAETRATRRVTRARSRSVAWLEIVALALIAVALIAATLTAAGRTTTSVPVERVRVERGQTLWELATRHPIEGLTTEQTADVISRLNDLDGGRLAAGKTIRIPSQADEGLLLACR